LGPDRQKSSWHKEIADLYTDHDDNVAVPGNPQLIKPLRRNGFAPSAGFPPAPACESPLRASIAIA
jgi:hypothetical protein